MEIILCKFINSIKFEESVREKKTETNIGHPLLGYWKSFVVGISGFTLGNSPVMLKSIEYQK